MLRSNGLLLRYSSKSITYTFTLGQDQFKIPAVFNIWRQNLLLRTGTVINRNNAFKVLFKCCLRLGCQTPRITKIHISF